jgi:hypothetical protein
LSLPYKYIKIKSNDIHVTIAYDNVGMNEQYLRQELSIKINLKRFELTTSVVISTLLINV